MYCNWLQLLEPTHSSGNFSSRIYHFNHLPFTISHLAFTANVFVIVNVIVYYYAKVQKNHELCKKNLYFFRTITDNNWLCATMSDKDWQCPPTAHQFFVPLSRVRKRKSTRWKSGVNTLKASTQHLSISGYSDYSENSDCPKDSDWLLGERDWNIEQNSWIRHDHEQIWQQKEGEKGRR